MLASIIWHGRRWLPTRALRTTDSSTMASATRVRQPARRERSPRAVSSQGKGSPGGIAAARMKLCFVGKYPPIQGGVARDSFWAAIALAQQDVEVHVVTNAREVEAEFRVLH